MDNESNLLYKLGDVVIIEDLYKNKYKAEIITIDKTKSHPYQVKILTSIENEEFNGIWINNDEILCKEKDL